MKWSHVGLNCRDQHATEEFYTTWFGFRRARAVPVGDGEIVFLRNGDAYLELFPAAADDAGTGAGPGSGAPDSGAAGGGSATADGSPHAGEVRHLAFRTDDVDAFLARLGEAADITLGPLGFDAFIDGWRTVWIRDPDGVIVEVSQGYHDAHPEPGR